MRDAVEASIVREPFLPNIPEAAKALERYGRTIYGVDAATNKDAQAARQRAETHIKILSVNYSKEEVAAAISELTKAIELSSSDVEFRATAILTRGGLYNMLSRYSEALADAENAERLGTLNLPLLATVEGQALVHLCRSQDDLKRAIGLITLDIQISGPTPFTVRARAEAYYGLRNFPQAIEEYRPVLNMLPQRFPLEDLGTAFGALIFRTCNSGMSEALRISAVFESRSGDPRASLMRLS